MVQRVEVKAFCDAHLARGAEVEATWSDVITVGKTTRRVELCEPCSEKERVASLEQWLRDVGTTVGAPAAVVPRPGPRKNAATTGDIRDPQYCDWNGCSEGPFRGKQGVSMHKRREHLGSSHAAEAVA